MSIKSNVTKALAVAAMTSAVLGMSADDAQAAGKGAKEKCYGVVKAGKNDCGNAAGTHSCAGQAAKDSDKGEWLYVPKGLCDKLAGGSTEPSK